MSLNSLVNNKGHVGMTYAILIFRKGTLKHNLRIETENNDSKPKRFLGIWRISRRIQPSK
jgi:hypothetical protein